MPKNDIRIEKLCINKYWIETHAKFIKINDIIRAKNNKEIEYKSISEPYWNEVDQNWIFDMVEVNPND